MPERKFRDLFYRGRFRSVFSEASALYERADLSKFTEHEIYPEIWTKEPKEQCIGYVTDYFKELKKFVANSALSGRALIAYIG